MGQEPLIPDDEVEEDGYLTEEQEATIFMSDDAGKRPICSIRELFRSSAKSSTTYLKETSFGCHVGPVKFVAVIDRLTQDGQYISVPSMDAKLDVSMTVIG